MSIEVNQVTKFYGSQPALQNVSFSVSKGEVVGFLGPNGAGKSTMMKILTCYIPASEGTAKVAGFSIEDDSLKVRKNVGYLPENNPLYPEMYIREYLHFVGGLYKIKNRKKRVEELIEMVGLTPESHKKIGELSKGYRQRVGLAQALIHDPEVLILDEPTSGLDPNQLEDIRKLIRKIGREKSVLLSTHIMQEVEAICDRVIIINRGKLVADNQVAALREAGEHDVIYLHLSGPLDLRKLEAIDGIVKSRGLEKGKYLITVEKGKKVTPEITSLASANSLSIEEIRKEERGLEEIFKSLTKEK